MKFIKKDIVVIIPAYNEIKHIRKVVEQVKQFIRNIIIVDDGSTDGTYDLMVKEKVMIARHMVNLGKGAAMRTGVEIASQLGFKRVIFMDSDGQHDPKDLFKFVKNLKKYDLVLGVRKLTLKDGGIRFLGNRLDTWLIKLLFGRTILDPLCGFRGFAVRIYSQIKWESAEYGVETEIVIRAIKEEIKFTEIPISTIYLDKYKGVSVLDAYKIFFDVLKWRLTL